jgi:C-terminal processing protease CtpA/Prc
MQLTNLLLAVVLQGNLIYSNSLGVVGVRIDSSFRINLVRPNTPAAAAGLQKGDKILLVNSEPRGEIDGEPGTPVVLKIQRGGQVFTVTIIRRDLKEMPWLTGHYSLSKKH